MNAPLPLLSRSLAFVLLVALPAQAGCREDRAPAPSAAPSRAIDVAASAAPIADAGPASDAGPVGEACPADAGATIPADAGLDASAWSDPGCPEGMARVGRFCIDRWEAHLIKRGPAGEIVPLSSCDRPPADADYEARSEPGVFPQAYISRVESALACKNAGKRLCSMTEWHHACGGQRGTLYPYGGHWAAKKCNSDRPHLLSIRFGTDPHHWRYEDFNDPTLDREPGFLEKTGVFDQCGGDYGVYDLVGNLHEWVSDTVDSALLAQMESEDVSRSYQPSHAGNGVFLGGFFSTHQELGPGCKFTTVAHEPAYHDYSTGFRCCASPPPGTSPERRR